MEFEPFFDDGQFEGLAKDSESEEYDDEEELEYDAINDETFGATVGEIHENDLEAFANRTADLVLDDPSCSINAPDPSQIPLPSVNSVFCEDEYKGSYDKIWADKAFNSGLSSHQNSEATPFVELLDQSNSLKLLNIESNFISAELIARPLKTTLEKQSHAENQSSTEPRTSSIKPDMLPQLGLAGAKTLEEIERDAVFNNSSVMPALSSPATSSTTPATLPTIPVSIPREPLNLEELEKKMLFEAALTSGLMATSAAHGCAIAQAISQLKNQPPPKMPPWLCGPPPMGQFPPGMIPPFFPPLSFLQGNPMGAPPPGMVPPPFFGPDGMPRHPMYNPFQVPPPPIHPNVANVHPPVKNFTGDCNNHQQQHHHNNKNNNQNYQKNSRGMRSLPVPRSWIPVTQQNRHSDNKSPFQPDSVPQCGYSRQSFSVQGSTSTISTSHNRQRQKGLPSGRTISDFAFDPYAGFMSKKEREWLIKIHLIQCMGGGEPMEDDFYYTMWKQRNTLEKAPEKWRVKLQPKYYNFGDTYPSAAYIHPSFSGSLGRPTHCSANFPRQMIDLSVENADEEDMTSTKNTQKKLKAILMRIENAALVLLKCDELKRKLSGRDLDEEDKIACKTTLKAQMDLLISCTCTKDKLPTIMLIQKGRVLLFKIMAGVLQQANLFDILKILTETMPKYAKKIPDISITDCIKNIFGFVSLLSKEQFVELVNLAIVDRELINISKFVQLTQFAFLIGLSKHDVNVDLISTSSLYNWLIEDAQNCVLLPEIEKLFASEDLHFLTQWLVNKQVVNPTNCAQKIVDCFEKVN